MFESRKIRTTIGAEIRDPAHLLGKSAGPAAGQAAVAGVTKCRFRPA
jgi:hypothetical protein